jgi:ferric-dicitrate binding protein FerR (iron transport regulator)
LSTDDTAELAHLIDVTDQNKIADILAQLMAASAEQQKDYHIDDKEFSAKVEQILAIDSTFDTAAINKAPKRALLRYLTAAAAAIIVLLGTYWMIANGGLDLKKTAGIAKTTESDVQPGQNGAILVLSDGTEVLLDSLGNSNLIVDGNGTKIKVQNGQITYLNNQSKGTNTINSVKTPKGRQYSLQLADGTKVWLNAASSIQYPVTFAKANRKVSISGEVYFEVAKDQKRPFIVNIEQSNTSIRVLGTHFNVNTYADNGTFKTSLLEGSIRLNTGEKQYLLEPNQQAISQPTTAQIQLIKGINTEDILAWKNDLFFFNEASLDDVMRELARWYDIEVVYEGHQPTGTFTGKIGKNLTLRQTLKILGATQVKYELTANNKLIIKQ